jgi:hypothetical protein
LLATDPAWAGAINTVLVKKDVRVNELRRVEETLLSPRDMGAKVDAPVSAMRHHSLAGGG